MTPFFRNSSTRKRILLSILGLFLWIILSNFHGIAQLALQGSALLRAISDAFAEVYEKVSPSVVVLEIEPPDPTSSILPRGWQSLLQRFPGTPPDDIFSTQGSGVVMDSDGHILTNNHVVAKAAGGSIVAILKDGRRFPARIIGTDEKTDVAVLKIDASNLQPATFGDSNRVRPGQLVFAIGAPLELPYTLTFGIVSATGRSNLTRSTVYENYIQTDASINPGNSGGPLCDTEGNVIGINTLISSMYRGLGFAIPSNLALQVAQQLISQGRVARPWLGITIEGLSESPRLRRMFPELQQGVVVQAILPGSPASRSELLAGDVILRIDGKEVSRAGDVQQAVLNRGIGEEVTLEIWRQGKVRILRIRTAEQPKSVNPWVPMLQQFAPFLPTPSPSTPTPTPSPTKNHSPQLPAAPSGLRFRDATADELAAASDAPPPAGVYVTEVEPQSPAATAGLLPGDIITHADHEPVKSAVELEKLLASPPPEGRGRLLHLLRQGGQTFAILR